MSEPVTIKLRKPITFGSRTVEQLTIRPIKAKDLRRLKDSDSDLAKAIAMACHLTGEITEIIDELQGADLAEVLKVVNDFFHAIHGTGEKPSES